jgi:hypothetical protein
MSEVRIDRLQLIIANALTDHSFRDTLFDDPAAASEKHSRVNLTAGEIEILLSLKDDLNRFRNAVDLHPLDAEMWAAGAIITAVARGPKSDWKVRVTSIPRFHVPPRRKCIVHFISAPGRGLPKKVLRAKKKQRSTKKVAK